MATRTPVILRDLNPASTSTATEKPSPRLTSTQNQNTYNRNGHRQGHSIKDGGLKTAPNELPGPAVGAASSPGFEHLGDARVG